MDRSISEPQNEPSFRDDCCNIIRQSCRRQLENILVSNDRRPNHGVEINFVTGIWEDYPNVGTKLLQDPVHVLNLLDSVAMQVLEEMILQGSILSTTMSLEEMGNLSLHARIYSLPICPQLTFTSFPESKMAGSFISIMGTVVRVSVNNVLEHTKLYSCNRCNTTFEVDCLPSRSHAFPKSVLLQCPNTCDNATITPVDNTTEGSSVKYRNVSDYQEVKLQEYIRKLDFGNTPKSITVILEEDLINACNPGDDVTITGRLFVKFKPVSSGVRIEPNLVMKANHVQIHNEQKSFVPMDENKTKPYIDFWRMYETDPLLGRNVIISSFCPQIYGMYIVKLAMCVVLAGGVTRSNQGMTIRGESHILLGGDPGTGKSQILKYTSKLCPRSVMTTGIGTSSAGLTASAVKEKGEWHLEAGALVLADGGVCCIDEFSCMSEQDRTSIHEAMEQQSISVAKAGICVKLPTRVTIVAANNPKGTYDSDHPTSVNLGIAASLLSRFDLVLILLDSQNNDWDRYVSDFILGLSSHETVTSSPVWDMHKLQYYLVRIKQLSPKLTHDAWEVLSAYYEHQRQREDRNAGGTTLRLLEGLRRLSEGHARLMFREEVLVCDAVNAVLLMESSMHSSRMFSQTNCTHSLFPNDPKNDYLKQAQVVLETLKLGHLWNKENGNLIPRSGHAFSGSSGDSFEAHLSLFLDEDMFSDEN